MYKATKVLENYNYIYGYIHPVNICINFDIVRLEQLIWLRITLVEMGLILMSLRTLWTYHGEAINHVKELDRPYYHI
jgi:hypothetical protein